MKMFVLCTAAALLAASASVAHASRAVVRIVNNSPVTITEMFTSPTTSPYIGDADVLGPRTIRPGASHPVDFDVPDAENECRLDVHAVGSDGRKWRWRMNVCREVSWTLRD